MDFSEARTAARRAAALHTASAFETSMRSALRGAPEPRSAYETPRSAAAARTPAAYPSPRAYATPASTAPRAYAGPAGAYDASRLSARNRFGPRALLGGRREAAAL